MTIGRYIDGRDFRRADLWKNLEDAHDLRPMAWTGYTAFMTTAEYSNGLGAHLSAVDKDGEVASKCVGVLARCELSSLLR